MTILCIVMCNAKPLTVGNKNYLFRTAVPCFCFVDYVLSTLNKPLMLHMWLGWSTVLGSVFIVVLFYFYSIILGNGTNKVVAQLHSVG